jgi:hypothetical protein
MKTSGNIILMTAICVVTFWVFMAVRPAPAQEIAPGWRATGHWQCGPVRIITSTDGFGGLDFFVIGAWFDNHYTVQRGQVFYNGVPCIAYGEPWPLRPLRRQAKREDCTEYLQDREVAETPEQQAAYDQCVRRQGGK